MNSSTHIIKGSLWDVLAVLLLPGLIQFWKPLMLFQVPEFFDSSFLQVKVSSGLHRSSEGPQGCWTIDATPSFLCAENCAWHCPQEILGTFRVKNAGSQTMEGDVIIVIAYKEISVRGLRQTGGFFQIECIYPDLLLKNVLQFPVPIHTCRNQSL